MIFQKSKKEIKERKLARNNTELIKRLCDFLLNDDIKIIESPKKLQDIIYLFSKEDENTNKISSPIMRIIYKKIMRINLRKKKKLMNI